MKPQSFNQDNETMIITQVALTIFALDYVLDFN